VCLQCFLIHISSTRDEQNNYWTYTKNSTNLNILALSYCLIAIQENEANLQKRLFRLNGICNDYNFKAFAIKSAVMTFNAMYPVRPKIILNNVI
jgi:hypothetical protein